MDPQTSGGLLAAVDTSIATELVDSGLWTDIGVFEAGGPGINLH
jgi:hypothetical protein